jgi:hypothetical protein
MVDIIGEANGGSVVTLSSIDISAALEAVDCGALIRRLED